MIGRFPLNLSPDPGSNPRYLRGSGITSRLADLYEDRFIAFALLAVGYSPPRPVLDLEKLLEYTKKVAGYELFGYWKFFSAPDAPELIEKNVRR